MTTENTNETLILKEKSESEKEIIKCYFCNKENSDDIKLHSSELYRRGHDEPSQYYVCSDKHDQKIKNFYKLSDNFYLVFLFFVIFVPIVLFALIFFLSSFVFAYGIFMSIGLGLVILPLIGNQIIKGAGLKISNLIGRILGAVLIAIGLILLFTNGLKFIIS